MPSSLLPLPLLLDIPLLWSQPPGAWTVWFPKVEKGGKFEGGGKPGGKVVIIGMFARLKPRGVPAVRLWLFMGKWPLLLASEREGAMWDGSRT